MQNINKKILPGISALEEEEEEEELM